MAGALNADSHDFFWLVDSRTNTYRILTLTGSIDSDANRIYRAVQEKVAADTTFPVERVKQRLAEAPDFVTSCG